MNYLSKIAAMAVCEAGCPGCFLKSQSNAERLRSYGDREQTTGFAMVGSDEIAVVQVCYQKGYCFFPTGENGTLEKKGVIDLTKI
jgi:hypothetical protein